VESLRAINANLRERIEVLEHRCAHGAEVLAMPVDTEAWTPKTGDRVRIAREPFEVGCNRSDWEKTWGKVGDVGRVLRMTAYGNADVQGIGDSAGTDRSYFIDPSCLDLVLP
jgi:hypothetical protein